MPQIGHYSRPSALSKLDGRTKEAKLVRETREALINHLGGAPSVTQSAMIERAVQLTLRVAAMDRKFAKSGEMTEHDSRTYLAWSASLARVMRDLGLKATPAQSPRTTLSHYLAAQPAAQTAEAA